jgi:hypothetical protein
MQPSPYEQGANSKPLGSGVALQQTPQPRTHHRIGSTENGSLMSGSHMASSGLSNLMTSSSLMAGTNNSRNLQANNCSMASKPGVSAKGGHGHGATNAGGLGQRRQTDVGISQSKMDRDIGGKVPKLSLLSMSGYSDVPQRSSKRNKENQGSRPSNHSQTKSLLSEKPKVSSPLQSDRNSDSKCFIDESVPVAKSSTKNQAVEEEYLKALSKLEQKKERLLTKQKEDHEKVARLFAAIAQKKGLTLNSCQDSLESRKSKEHAASERDSQVSGSEKEEEETMKRELAMVANFIQSISQGVFIPSHIRNLVAVWGEKKEESMGGSEKEIRKERGISPIASGILKQKDVNVFEQPSGLKHPAHHQYVL